MGGVKTDPSFEFIRLQGEREELVRFAREAIQEAELAASKRRGKARQLPPGLRQLKAYVAVLDERDRPGLEAVEAALAGQLTETCPCGNVVPKGQLAPLPPELRPDPEATSPYCRECHQGASEVL
jgi:hypothetical protein